MADSDQGEGACNPGPAADEIPQPKPTREEERAMKAARKLPLPGKEGTE